jgi:ABC-type glycerol-3-phosphate transport system permease component
MNLSIGDYIGISLLLIIAFVVIKFIIPMVIDTHKSQKDVHEIHNDWIENATKDELDEYRKTISNSSQYSITSATVTTTHISDTTCVSCDAGC